jgi:hypothetical protein
LRMTSASCPHVCMLVRLSAWFLWHWSLKDKNNCNAFLDWFSPVSEIIIHHFYWKAPRLRQFVISLQ